MLKLLVICIILGAVPLLLGKLLVSFDDIGKKQNLACEYVIGFLCMLALFQILCIPMTYLRVSFTVLTVIYTILIVGLGIGSIYLYIKSEKWKTIELKRKYRLFEVIYICAFAITLVVQVYYAITSNLTYMSFDDWDYIVTANMAIHDDGMFLSDIVTGMPLEKFTANRVLTSYLIFVGYLAKISGYPVTIIAHTILPVFLILQAYCAYFVIAKSLFKKREDRWIFMLLLAIINIYGEFSKSSMTFRLLGPIWNGKGVLMAVVIPFIFGIIPFVFAGEYKHIRGLYLLIIAIAASSLTLMGTIMPVIIFFVLSVLYFIVKRNKAYIYYLGWSCIVPMVFAVMYLVSR